MEWKGRRESENVEVSRGIPKAGLAAGGGIGIVIIGLIAFVLTGDPGALLDQIGGRNQQPAPAPGEVDPAEKEMISFIKVVVADTEDVWEEQFRTKWKKKYHPPKLEIFRDKTDTGCGFGDKAMGPFYCPPDNRIYLDLSFFEDLKKKYKAPGDFAVAYVIAHEVGHHIQNQLGVSDWVHRQKPQLSTKEYNDLSVRLELQADFYAGVWAHHIQKKKKVLEPGDLEEALKAADAIGDDRLQKQGRGYAVPDSFTHGTSAQRMRWLKKGFETGDVFQGDTFKAKDL